MIKRLASKRFSTPDDARDTIGRWCRYFKFTNLSISVQLILERAIFQGITTYRVIYEMMLIKTFHGI